MKAWLLRHAQTFVGSLGRIAQQPVAALLTMAVIGVALALPLLLQVLLANSRAATADWDQGFDVSVYLDKKAAPARAAALAKRLRARDDVAAVRVVTAEQAMTEFRTASGFGSALDALHDNPLPDSLVVTPAVAASTPQGTQSLQRALAALPDVQIVQVDTAWVERLYAILEILRRIIELLGGLLGVGVILVVGNTIRLDILNRRAEIEVMKLVGATDGFARRPFLYSGIWYGLGGGVIAWAVVGITLALLESPVRHLAGLYGSSFRLVGVGVRAGCAVLGTAALLGWLGSWLAATRHIRRIEPT